jgi:hypothetical protein
MNILFNRTASQIDLSVFEVVAGFHSLRVFKR